MQGVHTSNVGFPPRMATHSARFTPTLRPVRHVSKTPRCSATATELPVSLRSIVGSFQAVPDPMQRYKQLLFFATKLDPLPPEEHTPQNKVKGCVSQVWVVPELRDDGKIYWLADSDSQLTKGLAALLVQGLSGCTPEEIVRIQPDFIAMLGLQQSLTPSRNNGFLNMFKLMQAKALELYIQQETNGSGDSGNASSSQTTSPPAGNGSSSPTTPTPPTSSSSSSTSPVADSMRRKLQEDLTPLKLEIVDESHQHAGHGHYKGTAQYSGETHFSMTIVSEKFVGMTSLKRHRLVYSIVDEEFGNPVHALTLVTQTPEEAGLRGA